MRLDGSHVSHGENILALAMEQHLCKEGERGSVIWERKEEGGEGREKILPCRLQWESIASEGEHSVLI